MKKIRTLKLDHKDYFDKIIAEKNEPRKSHLIQIKKSVNDRYDEYHNLSQNSDISIIKDSTYSTKDGEVLKHCYESKTRTAIEYIEKIYSHMNKNNLNKCPYCEYYTIDSIDHYLPQIQYPEYSVYGDNLIPTCPKCNSKKNEYWQKDGIRLFLHSYIDKIPSKKFLYCQIHKNADSILDVTYSLNFEKDFDSEMKVLINSHFEKLELLTLYKERSNTFFTELRGTIGSFCRDAENDRIKESLHDQIIFYSDTYGVNHWRSAFLEEVISLDEYILLLKK